MKTNQNTNNRLLDAGEVLLQRHGYHGFSFAQVADAVGIRKASVHHHFPSKADLAEASVRRFRKRFEERLEVLGAHQSSLDAHLEGFALLFRAARDAEGQMCLCAALAADWASLPESTKAEVTQYWNNAIDWLAEAIVRDANPEPLEARRVAGAIFSMFEGAMLSARVLGGAEPIDDALRAARGLVATPTT